MTTNNTSPDDTAAELARLRMELHGAQHALEEASRERVRASLRADAAEWEVAALRAIVAGRTVPPTDAEIAAHEAAGGRWRCVVVGDCLLLCDMLPGGVVWYHAETLKVLDATGTWWALDATGRPCAWPVADVSDTARRGGV